MTKARGFYMAAGGPAAYQGFPDQPPTFTRYLCATAADVPAGAALGDVPGGWTVLSTLGADSVTFASDTLPDGCQAVAYQIISTPWTDGGGPIDASSWLFDLGTAQHPDQYLFAEGTPSSYGFSTGASLLSSPAVDLSGQRLRFSLYGQSNAGLLTGTCTIAVYTYLDGGKLA